MCACSPQSQLGLWVCFIRYTGLRQAEVILPLFSALVRPQLEHWILLWDAQHKKDTELLEQVQKRATMMIKGLEHHSYKDRLKELELFSLQKAPGKPYSGLPVPKGGYRKGGMTLN